MELTHDDILRANEAIAKQNRRKESGYFNQTGKYKKGR